MTAVPSPGTLEMPLGQRWLARLALVALSTALFAAVVWDVFRPEPRYLSDFSQDWLSARDVLDGRPAYSDLGDAVRRHLDGEPPPTFLDWNAHPPGSVVLILPLALADHNTALFLWNLINFPLVVVAVGVVLREFGVRGLRNEAITAIAIGLGGVSCYPLFHQFVMGQFNALLAFLVAVAWAADRNGRANLAGIAVGVAAAVKLFPAFLLAYFLLAGRWRAFAVAVGVVLLLSGASVAVLGIDAYRTYATEVIPAVTKRYATQWNNVTLSGFWLRVFDPVPASNLRPVVYAPLAGKVAAALTRGAMAALVAWAAWTARRGGLAARDRAFSCAVVGMILVSPIAWPHYFIILLVPVSVMLARQWNTGLRWPLVVCVLLLWLRETMWIVLWYGQQFADDMVNNQHPPLPAGEWLLVAGPLHYALVGLFVLSLRLPTSDAS
jgi:hypothetical protein